MDEIDQLEKFRTQWKSELKSKKDAPSSSTVKCQNDQNKTDTTSNTAEQKYSKFSYFHNVNEEHDQAVAGHSDNIMKCHPFDIVDNLLCRAEHICSKNEPEGHAGSEGSVASCSNTVKRKCPQRATRHSQYKKSKTLNLKNIGLFSNNQTKEKTDEKLLDLLIADIDEITEIPFFDTSLPREVAVNIFQHLSMVDLCQCAQVSKSWRSLAEDELLWCRLCHKLGHENIYTTREKTNWKQIVQHNIERRRSLIANWKNRIGKLSPLEHVKGKILCAVHSHGSKVVAGYTSGEVKLWDLSGDESCVYQPSNTSLLLDVNEDVLQENIVKQVVTSEDITVALYSQGNVDIWSLDNGSQPIQTLKPTSQHLSTQCVCLSDDGTSLVVSYNSCIDVLHKQQNEFTMLHHYDSQDMVKHTKLYNNGCDILPVIYANKFSVHMYQPVQQGTEYVSHVTELHNLIGAPVEVVDFKTDQSVLGVGLGSYSAMMDGYRVKLYDIKTGKLLQTLVGHTWLITCMDMLYSPHNELVVATGDRKLQIYDMRNSKSVQRLIGHASKVSCVQMDDWKVVSGADDGFMCVWDRRMATKLWDLHNRHPVRYCHFDDKTLICANISASLFPELDEFDGMAHRRYRGSLNVYNFLEDLTTKHIPEICLSTYDQPDASKYNIGLAVPYDTLQY